MSEEGVGARPRSAGRVHSPEGEQLEESRGRFVALAAHELRAPATVIHGIATTLDYRGDRLDAEQLSVLHRLLHEHTGRLVRLADQLLDLTRLDHETAGLEPRRVRVRDRVRELVDTVAGDRANEVEIDVDDALVALVDPGALDRIVGNLLTNALRYGTAPVRISAEQSDRQLRLSVEDDGTGVAPEFEPRLFERFSREANASMRGAGLGLAIAQQYAREHGGRVVYERRQRGACFRVVLTTPRAPA
jgi:two-component system sensor histidine kinase MtrB